MAKSVSFSDLMVTQQSKGSTRLEKIDGLVRWSRFGYRLTKILGRSGLGPTGYPPLSLFKALILQHLYGLSDPEMEEMLYDRLSFRRFCGFGLSDNIPDATTLCRFRNALAGQTEKLFGLVLDEIQAQGITLKSGTIVDATVIQSSAQDPCGGTVSARDPEAGWTKKGGKYHHGYKAHVACDVETGLVTTLQVTGAEVHDSQVFEVLLTGEETCVYADKAYASTKRRKRLREAGIGDCVMYPAQAGRKQPAWQKHLNTLWSKTRCRIEKIFGHMKRTQKLLRARYIGQVKTLTQMSFVAMAYNLVRALSLIPRPCKQAATG